MCYEFLHTHSEGSGLWRLGLCSIHARRGAVCVCTRPRLPAGGPDSCGSWLCQTCDGGHDRDCPCHCRRIYAAYLYSIRINIFILHIYTIRSNAQNRSRGRRAEARRLSASIPLLCCGLCTRMCRAAHKRSRNQPSAYSAIYVARSRCTYVPSCAPMWLHEIYNT